MLFKMKKMAFVKFGLHEEGRYGQCLPTMRWEGLQDYLETKLSVADVIDLLKGDCVYLKEGPFEGEELWLLAVEGQALSNDFERWLEIMGQGPCEGDFARFAK